MHLKQNWVLEKFGGDIRKHEDSSNRHKDNDLRHIFYTCEEAQRWETEIKGFSWEWGKGCSPKYLGISILFLDNLHP